MKFFAPALIALYRRAAIAYICFVCRCLFTTFAFVHRCRFCLSLLCMKVPLLPIFALYAGATFDYLCFVWRRNWRCKRLVLEDYVGLIGSILMNQRCRWLCGLDVF